MMGILLKGQKEAFFKRQWTLIPLFVTTRGWIKTMLDVKQVHPPHHTFFFQWSAVVRGTLNGGSQVKRGEIDFHSERNYMDIPLDIHCSEGNQIYAGIKCNVPSQIFSECGDVFSLHEKTNQVKQFDMQFFETRLLCYILTRNKSWK